MGEKGQSTKVIRNAKKSPYKIIANVKWASENKEKWKEEMTDFKGQSVKNEPDVLSCCCYFLFFLIFPLDPVCDPCRGSGGMRGLVVMPRCHTGRTGIPFFPLLFFPVIFCLTFLFFFSPPGPPQFQLRAASMPTPWPANETSWVLVNADMCRGNVDPAWLARGQAA